MSCPNCPSKINNLLKTYGFLLEKNNYYMTQVDEIKKCCPVKVYVTQITAKDVYFTYDGKEYKKTIKDFYKSSWRLYDSY